MAGHQVAQRLAIRGIKIEPLGTALGELEARIDVVLRRHRFARIVQQQAEVEEFRLLEFCQQIGKPPVPFRFRFFQVVQVLYGEKGMLVDRVAMIKIANHERFHALEFRQQKCEQAKRVHGAQGIGRVRLKQGFLQVKPQLPAPRRRGRERGQSLLDFIFRGGAEFQPVLGHEVKQAQEFFCILQHARLLQKDQAVDHGKIIARNLGPPALKLAV